MSSLRSFDRKTAYAVTVFLIFCHYMVWQVNFYLAATLKTTYYMMAVPVLVAGVLYFRRLRDGLEFRLMLAYWIWFIFSRFLHNNLALEYDFQLTFDLGLMFPFFSLGFALGPERRRRFLDWFSAAVGGYYFLLGLISLLAFIQRKNFINPITEGNMGMLGSEGFQRINIMDTNPNSSAYWFMIPFFLMIYQFFACRKKAWRIPIALCALVDFAVIAVTYTRSVKLAVAVATALLLLLPLRRLLKTPRKLLRVSVLVLGFLVSFVLIYKLSDYCAEGLTRVSYTLYPAASVEDSAGTTAAEAAEAAADPRGWTGNTAVVNEEEATQLSGWLGRLDDISSLRVTVWLSALKTIRLKPSILWKGELFKDLMVISNTFTPHNPPHYHNVLIQVLMSTGLPGFLIVLVLFVITAVKLLRLFFSPDPKIPTAARTLALPVFAGLVYGMLEIMVFTYSDIRALYYYLMSGIALSVYYEFFPKK